MAANKLLGRLFLSANNVSQHANHNAQDPLPAANNQQLMTRGWKQLGPKRPETSWVLTRVQRSPSGCLQASGGAVDSGFRSRGLRLLSTSMKADAGKAALLRRVRTFEARHIMMIKGLNCKASRRAS